MVRHVIAVYCARCQCGAFLRRACIGAVANIHRRRIRTSTSLRIRARWHTLIFWSRLPPRAMRQIRSSSQAHGRMYDTTTLRAETLALTIHRRSTRASRATTATSSTRTGSSR
jgi:hypothetical protein